MESSPAARVLAAPCHPANPYPSWYGSATAHQMAHSVSQGSFIPFPGAHAGPTHVMAANQASGSMYNLHNQYHQYHAVGSSNSGTPTAMSMTHGFIGSPHHAPTPFGHPGSAGGDHSSMGAPFSAAAFMFNVERTNDSKSYFQF